MVKFIKSHKKWGYIREKPKTRLLTLHVALFKSGLHIGRIHLCRMKKYLSLRNKIVAECNVVGHLLLGSFVAKSNLTAIKASLGRL